MEGRPRGVCGPGKLRGQPRDVHLVTVNDVVGVVQEIDWYHTFEVFTLWRVVSRRIAVKLVVGRSCGERRRAAEQASKLGTSVPCTWAKSYVWLRLVLHQWLDTATLYVISPARVRWKPDAVTLAWNARSFHVASK